MLSSAQRQGSTSTDVKRIDTAPTSALGPSLDGAPHIGEDAFVGREAELAQLREWLSPTSKKGTLWRVSGLGGMGKTQLSLQFAERCHEVYSSVCWINAQEERTLKMGFVALGRRIAGENILKSVGDDDGVEEIVQQVRQWFSCPDAQNYGGGEAGLTKNLFPLQKSTPAYRILPPPPNNAS